MDASNGVVHIIDKVLVPPAPPAPAPAPPALDIVDLAASNKNLTTLVAAIKAAGLVDTLSGKGPYTVFAPTNDAFERLAPGTLPDLLKPENKAKLVDLLTLHVVPDAVLSKNLFTGELIPTVEGGKLSCIITGRKSYGRKYTIIIGEAAVEVPDVLASNGVVHIIDNVVNNNFRPNPPV